MISYISEEGKVHMQKFQYKGTCDSITYRHLWSPFAEYLLRYVPEIIAPNTITATALAILTIAHILFVSGVGEQQPIAAWRLIVMAVTITIYQNLDNLDGKQARKTKTSTPLGMLFDHGADAVIAFLLAIQVMEILQISSPAVKIFTLAGLVMLVYFCALWSQYSIGYFRLGQVNPVDEGLPCYSAFAIVNIFVDPEFWNTPTPFFDLKVNEVLLLMLLVVGCFIIYYMVYKNYKDAIRPISEVNQVLLLPFSYAVAILALFYSEKHPLQAAIWPLYYILMFSWSRNMIQIQLYHVTKQIFNPFNVGTMAFILPVLIYLYVDCDANKFFWGVALLQGLLFIQFVISVSRQSAEILDINVFSIKEKDK